MSRRTKVAYTWINLPKLLLEILVIVGISLDRASGTQLAIVPDLNGLMICGSSVVFTCTLQTAPPIAMSWKLNSTNAAECTATGCDLPYGMPAHYTTTFISGTVTELRINPVKLTDNYIIECTDGNADSIGTSVKVGALPLTYSVNTQGDETNITVVSSCVFSPLSSVKFKIQNNNTGAALNLANGNNILTPTESVVCTDAENPNCGGSSTAKAKAVLTITTQATGTPTEISIVAVQSDEDLSPPQYIGSYILKVPEVTTPKPDDESDRLRIILGLTIGFVLSNVVITLCVYRKKVLEWCRSKRQLEEDEANQTSMEETRKRQKELEKKNQQLNEEEAKRKLGENGIEIQKQKLQDIFKAHDFHIMYINWNNEKHDKYTEHTVSIQSHYGDKPEEMSGTDYFLVRVHDVQSGSSQSQISSLGADKIKSNDVQYKGFLNGENVILTLKVSTES